MENPRLEETGPRLTKQCSKCLMVKLPSEFHKSKGKKFGLQHYCKTCRLGEDFQRRYGITMDQWNQMFIDQCGRCVICEVDLPPMGKGVHTDHCHTHGAVRGLLCSHCNTGLGSFSDNPNILRKAAEYIEDNVEKVYERHIPMDGFGDSGLRGYGARLRGRWSRGRSYRRSKR